MGGETPRDALDARPVLDLRQLFGIAWRYHRAIIASVFGAVLLGLVATFLMTPRYTAFGTIQVDQEEQRILDSQEQAPAANFQESERFLKTTVDVLRSRQMAERVGRELDLFEGDAFFELMRASAPNPELANYEQARNEAIVKLIHDNLQVSLANDSRVVTIGFTSPDPEFSARFVNNFITNFLRYNIERRLDKSVYARDFLSEQLEEARQRLQRAERAANDYARNSGVVRLPSGSADGSESTLTAVDLGRYNEALTNARNARIAAQSRWEQVRDAPALAIPEVAGNQALQSLYGERAKLAAKLEQELATKQANHPTVVPIRQELSEYDRQIERLTSGVRESIRDNFLTAQNRENELIRRVSGLVRENQRERDDSVQLNTLLREVETSRQLYDGLLQRFREMSAEANITANNVQQIDVAEPPVKPSSPRLLLNLALALLGGMGLAAAYIFFREQIDDRIRSPGELQDRLGVKLLGITPVPKDGATPEEAMQDPKSPLSEAFYSIRTALQFADAGGLPGKLLVTSSQKEEGKSLTAYGIACAIGDLGKSVVLVDCDLRRPTVHKKAGVENGRGMVELLTGEATLDEALKSGTGHQVSVLPAGSIATNPGDLLASDRFAALLDDLEARFDIVILDAPPVLGLADAVILSALPQAKTMMLADAQGATRGRLRGAIERLRAGGADILGVVFSRYDLSKSRFANDGYSYGGYAYYEYEA
nr:polysaccharide biosynthesis tyrosine autokinase [Qipengyuania sphaerica]